MTITTKFNIGDTVKIKELRVTNFGFVDAEIRRIVVSKDGDGNTQIRYTLTYPGGGEWLSRDVWESDLVQYQEEAKETCR